MPQIFFGKPLSPLVGAQSFLGDLSLDHVTQTWKIRGLDPPDQKIGSGMGMWPRSDPGILEKLLGISQQQIQQISIKHLYTSDFFAGNSTVNQTQSLSLWIFFEALDQTLLENKLPLNVQIKLIFVIVFSASLGFKWLAN